jgi:hypothetical protein
LTRRATAIAIAVAAVVMLGGGQVLIPSLAEHRVEHRLTANGGSAEVELRAVPAVRLLFGHGDEIRVRGRDLEFELSAPRGDALERLDRFDRVDVRLARVTAGPFDVSSFALERDGPGPYALRMRSSFSPAGLAGMGAGRLGAGNLLGGLLGLAIGQTVPGAGHRLPLDLDLLLESDHGRARVKGGRATVAGFPVGPLAELITAAIAVRI